eukprot:Gb_31916 [translate_table: standard]
MGPREKRRLNKKKGFVFKHGRENSSSQNSSVYRGNHVETSLSKITLNKEETDDKIISSTSRRKDALNFINHKDVNFLQDYQETESVEAYINGSAVIDEELEASLLSAVNEQIDVAVDCLEIEESNTLQSGSGGPGEELCKQGKDTLGIICVDETGSNILVGEQYHSCSTSPMLNPSAGTDYTGEEVVEPMENASATSQRVQKISLLGHGPHGKKVVEKLLEEEGEDGIRQFSQQWRLIFVEAVNPRFLPSGWDIQHSGRREFGDYSVYNPSRKVLAVT